MGCVYMLRLHVITIIKYNFLVFKPIADSEIGCIESNF